MINLSHFQLNNITIEYREIQVLSSPFYWKQKNLLGISNQK